MTTVSKLFQRLGASIDVRRAWRGLLGMLVVAALVIPAQAAMFCHMSEQVTTSCCCANMAADDLAISVSSGTEASDAPPPPVAVDPPCCDSLRDDSAVVPSTQARDRTPLSATVTKRFVSWRVPTPRLAFEDVILVLGEARAPVLARGPPPRRGKLRSRIGVTTC